MKRIRKRIVAAALAAVIAITMPGTASYALEENGQTEYISDISTEPEEANVTEEPETETDDIEKPETEDSGTEEPETGTGDTEEPETDTEETTEKEPDSISQEDAENTEQRDIGTEDDSTNLCAHHKEHTKDCGYSRASEDGEGSPCTYECRLCPIEDMIAALPRWVTEDNRAEVEAQLQEILDLWRELTEEEQDQLDMTLCWDLLAALDEVNVHAPIDEPAEGDVAAVDIGGIITYYNTIQEAWTAACGADSATVTMLADAEITESLNIDSSATNITFQGGDFTLSVTDDCVFYVEYGKLTIESGTILANSKDKTSYGVWVSSYASVDIQGGTIRAPGRTESFGGHGVYFGYGSSNVTISEGVEIYGEYRGIYMMEGTCIIKGGTISSDMGTLYVTSSAKLQISDGTFNGGSDYIIHDRAENISRLLLNHGSTTDETHYAFYSGETPMEVPSGEYIKGDTITVKECTHMGAFTANNDGTHSLNCQYCGYTEEAADCSYGDYQHDETNHWQTCTGCGYTGPTAPHTLGEGNVCEGCGTPLKVQVEIGNDTTYYGTFSDAWEAARSAQSAVVTLLDHVTAELLLYMADGDQITLNGGSHTLFVNTAIEVGGGKLDIIGGTFEMGYPLRVSGGTVRISGGAVIKGNPYGVHCMGESADIKISGGTITGSENAVILGPGKAVSDLLENYGGTTGTHYAFYQNGIPVTSGLDSNFLPSGTYTVAECTHVYTEQSYSHVKGTLTHTQTCGACGAVEEVDCEYTGFGETYNIKVCACGATLTASLTDADGLVYNGTEHKLDGVTFTVDGTTPRDVKVVKTYTGNKDAGTATLALIDVDGVFWGILLLEFAIAKATPVVTWNGGSEQTLTYTGQAAVTADVQLVNDETGTVTYSYAKQGSDSYISGLPTDVGTYSVKAVFAEQKNYVAAEAELKLTIDKADSSVSIVPKARTLTYNGEAQTLVSAGTAVFGDVVYAQEKNGTYSTTIPTGTNAGSYTVWYKVEDHNNYNGVAAVKVDVAISPKLVNDPTIELSPDTFECDGQEKTPKVTVKDGSTVIPVNEYTVEYRDNLQVGEATVTISNVEGNYIVNGSKNFEITKPSLETAEVTLSETSYIYDGTAKTPEVTVEKGGVLIPEDQYVVTYSNTNGGENNHTNAGTVTVTVTAKADGQYSGSNSTTFTIAKVRLTEAMVTLSEESATYNGVEQKPAINVKQENGTILAEDTDYEVAYSAEDFTNVGTFIITIKGKGNYDGTVEKAYAIKQATPTIAWSNTTQELTYTGQPAAITEPAVTLENNESFDGPINYSYAVSGNSYTDGLPVNAGTYTVRAAIAEQKNYTAAESTDTLSLIIDKAEGTLTVPDTPIAKKYGEADFSLECATNGDGEISYASDNEAVVTVSTDGMVQINGPGEATVTVSLAEGTNHTAADDRTITITVDRDENAPNMPDSVINVPDSCLKVGDVALPENWEWREEDRDKALQDETAVEVVAVYTGADKDNYETITATVAVMSHKAEDVLYTGAGEKEPGCTESGLGHRECVTCHAVVETGIAVGALGHDYTGTVTKEPTASEEGEMTHTCSRCGDTYTEPIPVKIPEGLWISGLTRSVPYTGSAVKPEGISVYHGDTLLREKTEYTISYKSNTNAGTAQLIVTGKGNYKGKCTAEFTIEPVDLTADSGISATIATVTEIGRNLKPAVTVTWNGKKLKEKKDYTLSYETGIKTASEEGYAVTISGKGNYAGSIERRFYVKPRGTKLLNSAKVTGIKKSYEYNRDGQNGEENGGQSDGQNGGQNGDTEGKSAAPKGLEDDLKNITVKVGTTTLIKDTDYTVHVENGNAVGTGYVVIEPTQTSDYAGEKRISFNITGTNIKKCFITGLAKSYPYTGNPIMPEIQVYTGKNGTGTQIPSDAYTVSYSNYTNQGKATVTVTGIPEKGCSGSVKATYSIGRLNLAIEKEAGIIMVTMPGDIKYAKGGAKPQPVLLHSDNGVIRILREGVDYTLKYSNNTAKYSTPSGSTSTGSTKIPTLKITGIGNYTGTITENYDINVQDISKLEITVADKAYNSKKKGSYYYSVPKVYDFDGKLLKSGKDYTVKYINEATGQEIGKTDTVENGTQIRVTVTAKENSSYEGTLSRAYYVRDAKDVKDISKAKNDRIAAQQYTGSSIEPEVKLYTLTGKTKNYLAEEDYEIIGYYNNIKRGTATVLIRGTGAYSGVKSITFKITSADNKLIWIGIF